MEKLQGEVISMIRGCLISSKGEMSLRQLDIDYKTLCGERIPYGKLGYRSLEELIRTVPSLMIRTDGKDKFVRAETSEKSLHIQQMVNKQKSSKKSSIQKAVRFSTPNYQKPAQTWRPNNKWKANFQSSPRPAAVAHNQFVNRPVLKEKNVPANKVDLSERLSMKPTVTSNNNQNGGTDSPKLKISNQVTLIEEPSMPCSSLISAKKRISKKMSEINLERDSGNSSPTGDIIPKIQEFPPFSQTDNPIVDLKNFVELYKIGKMEVSCNEVKPKKKTQGFFTCKIKVGNHTYYSYPQEFKNPVEAEKFCAKKALEELIPKYSRRKSLLLASDKDILQRIPPMLERHTRGIWGWQLELDYAYKYNEQLPVDWLKIIDSSPCIQVEKCLEHHVLRHCKPGDVLQKGQKWNTRMIISDVSVPANTVQFKEDGRLTAQVTYVMSANEIWCRQCDTSEFEAYNIMTFEMDQFYNTHSNTLHVEDPSIGRNYAAQLDNGWYRIRVVSMEGDAVSCFFIDFGDENVLTKDNVYQLKREFAVCQAQAFVCRLEGLEELYDASINSEQLQGILSKQVILELASENTDENLNDISTPVFMYDFQSGACINKELIPLLTMESASPVLKAETIAEVYITNLESNGDIYLQCHSKGFEKLQKLLANLEEQVLQNPPSIVDKPTKENSEGKLFFAKYKPDGHWHRVQIIDWAPQGQFAQIYYIDYGNADVVNTYTENIYPLDILSEVLTQFPPQAVKVKMALDVIPPNFVDLASKLMPVDQLVLVKIMGYDAHNVPFVELFKRNPDEGLFCINKSIIMESELKKKQDDNNNTNKLKRKVILFDGLSKNVPSGGTLQRPPLPDKGEYFEIHVSFAVNPYNFFVQPLKSRNKLNTMMESLQKRYQNVQYSPLQTEDIIPGQIYASKHEDDCWYRTSVIKVIHKGSISVFYCDFGYYANLTVQQLIPLDMEFMGLPYQALKARLADIKPKQNKWTVEDCEYFKKKVEKTNLYSVLNDIAKDELYDSDIVLNLTLIDTSGDQDVYIGDELINKGIAVKC